MRIYTYGVYDLFHYGHLRALKKAKELGDELVVGVFTDKVAESFKRKPIMNEEERTKLINELGLSMVVYQDTFLPNEDILDILGIDVVAKAEGAGWSEDEMPKFKGIKSVLLDYTEGVRTSDIIKRIYDNK